MTVATFPSATFSLIELTSLVIAVTSGSSSLIKYKVVSVVFSLALLIVPGVIIIVSLTSISVSSKSFVEIETDPDLEFAGIIIESLLTVYSLSIVAVPVKVIGIATSRPDSVSSVAVNVNAVSEFSSISVDEDENVIVGKSSLSTMVRLSVSLDESLIFKNLLAVNDNTSSFSLDLSSIAVISTDPDVSPALIIISGFKVFLIILWFLTSEMNKLSFSSK